MKVTENTKKKVYVESRKSLVTRVKSVEKEYDHVGDRLGSISEKFSHISHLAKCITDEIHNGESRKELLVQFNSFMDICNEDIEDLKHTLDRARNAYDVMYETTESLTLIKDKFK